MCAKFGSDRFRNVNLYKAQTNKQTFSFMYKINVYSTDRDTRIPPSNLYVFKDSDRIAQ